MSGSVREYAILYVSGGKSSSTSVGGVIGGGNAIIKTPQHALDGFEHTAATTDPTRLDASTTRHGLLPKLSGDAADVLRGDGTFAPEAGASTDAYSLGSMGAAKTVDHANGTWQYGTLTADCTLTLSPVTSGKDIGLTLELLQDGAGGWTVTWPGSVEWLGGSAPTFDTTAGTTTIVGLLTRDGGATWVAGILGGGSGGTPATTVTDETTFGIAPAVGTDTEYARQDHTHGSPANPVTAATVKALGRWEPVTNGNVSTPEVVFEAGDIVMEWVT